MMTAEALALWLNPTPAGRCLLGLSGGADSVALLQALLLYQRDGTMQLEAIHVNHGLRGEASDGDEEFVRRLCEEQQVPLTVARLDLQGRRDENAAREARYEAFFSTMREKEIPTLILAHQREDQAETLLMRLMRGAGPEGLAGMRRVEKRGEFTLIRPMLDVSGAELRQMLQEEGQPWREDDSNREDAYLRNRIRHEILPRMEEMIPGSAAHIACSAGLIAEQNDAMERAARQLIRESRTPAGLRAEVLLEAAPALQSMALRAWWREEGPLLEERELNFAQTLRLRDLLEAERGTIINLPGGWRARREKDTIRLLEPGNRTKNNRPKGGAGEKHD